MGRKINSGLSTGYRSQFSLENFELLAKLNEQVLEIDIKNNNEEELINELIKKKIKINTKELIFIFRTKDGKIIWLENGNNKAGLQHIKDEHGEQFKQNGISEKEIPELIKLALKSGIYVGIQGRDRKIYKVFYKEKEIFIAISVSKNGFVVGANLTTKKKEDKNENN